MTTDLHRFRLLADVHPTLTAAVRRMVAELDRRGHTAIITQGARTTARQQALYAQGRTRPGKIVTNADGVRRTSMHQRQHTGYAHAVDLAWIVDARVTWDGPWALLGELARAEGLVWGGDWTSFRDQPHVELPLPAEG